MAGRVQSGKALCPFSQEFFIARAWSVHIRQRPLLRVADFSQVGVFFYPAVEGVLAFHGKIIITQRLGFVDGSSLIPLGLSDADLRKISVTLCGYSEMTIHAQQHQSLADLIEQTGHALTAVELADILAVSRITVFKQAMAGRIPSFRVGTCVRFDPGAVAAWLRGQ